MAQILPTTDTWNGKDIFKIDHSKFLYAFSHACANRLPNQAVPLHHKSSKHIIMDYTLRYNSSKGLYISDDNRDGDKILLSSHYIMHERRREFELTEDNFRVFVWSNFGCAYYMQAIIYYNGRKLLDFNPQKIFVLNHRELSIFYVSSTMGIDKAWLAIF